VCRSGLLFASAKIGKAYDGLCLNMYGKQWYYVIMTNLCKRSPMYAFVRFCRKFSSVDALG